MTLLNKEQILSVQDIHTKTVEVPEWGGEVIIRSMTAERHAQFEEISAGQGKYDALAFYAASILVDENGDALFDSAEDVKKLAGKSNTALIRILNAGIELNGISEGDLEANAKKS